jgi:hypothetical protein
MAAFGPPFFVASSAQERNQDGSIPRLNGLPSTLRRSGKKGAFWHRFCGIISPKRPKNGQRGAKIGQFQLLIS